MSDKYIALKDEYFGRGHNCAESTFLGAQDLIGVKDKVRYNVATGLGGGIGRKGKTCGAVTGGSMAISLSFTRERPDDFPEYDRVLWTVNHFVDQFQQRVGVTDCRDICRYNLNDPAEVERYYGDQSAMDRCQQSIVTALEIIDGMVRDGLIPSPSKE